MSSSTMCFSINLPSILFIVQKYRIYFNLHWFFLFFFIFAEIMDVELNGMRWPQPCHACCAWAAVAGDLLHALWVDMSKFVVLWNMAFCGVICGVLHGDMPCFALSFAIGWVVVFKLLVYRYLRCVSKFKVEFEHCCLCQCLLRWRDCVMSQFVYCLIDCANLFRQVKLMRFYVKCRVFLVILPSV